MRVAFDVDGTLVSAKDPGALRLDVAEKLRWHHARGDEVYVWSGGGVQYARFWLRIHGLERYVKAVIPKLVNASVKHKVELCYDDQDVNLAPQVVRV